MKKFLSIVCLICFVGVWSPVSAATRVPAGTTIPLVITQKVTSKSVTSGGTIDATVEDDVKVNGKVVFAKDATASLNVISAKKAGFVGIPGEMTIYGGKVYDINGNEHKIDFNRQIVGEEKTWPKVMLGCGVFIILAPLALFGFVKGGQAEIHPVPPIEVKLSNEFSL